MAAQCLNHHEFKVALRALGFDLKKPEVRKIMLDADKSGAGTLIDFDDFNKVGASVPAWRRHRSC